MGHHQDLLAVPLHCHVEIARRDPRMSRSERLIQLALGDRECWPLPSSRSASSFVKTGGMCWTISMGTGKSIGNPGSRSISACGPPVDTPIATTSIRPARSRARSGVSERLRLARKARHGTARSSRRVLAEERPAVAGDGTAASGFHASRWRRVSARRRRGRAPRRRHVEDDDRQRGPRLPDGRQRFEAVRSGISMSSATTSG